LQREIAYWFATQFTAPTKDAEIKGQTPKQIVDTFADALRTKKETYTLGFYKLDSSGGHAVTPYGVVDKGSDVQWLMIYDNNYPREERHIEIDRKADTWKYSGSTRPDVPADEYHGTAASKTLTLTPTSARLEQQECPF